MDARELSDLVAWRRIDALVDGLRGLNERQRKALAPGVGQMLDWRNKDRYPAWPLVLAALGCLGGERQVARGLEWIWRLDTVDEAAAQVLRDRSPHWLPKLPGALLGANNSHWQLVRVLVLEGVVEMPEEPEYLTGMVWGLVAPSSGQAVGSRTVRDALLADPGLLDRELWLMLATERSGRQLTMTDGSLERFRQQFAGATEQPMPTHNWWHALVTLAAEGRIDRGRLLDAALAAPLRDWAPADVSWFIGLHDALVPTLDEVVARQATYCRLLACDHGPAVKVAQKHLGKVVRDQRLETHALLSASEMTLARTDKTTVLGQLALLKALLKDRPDLGDAATRAVAVALDHPRSDVRERAEALLTSLGVAPDRAMADVEFVPPLAEPRPEAAPVEPVADPDELVELLLRLVEEADDPLEVERAFEGVLRFPGASSSAGDALLRRLDQLQLWGLDPRLDVAAVARVWLVKQTWRQRLTRSIGAANAFVAKPRDGSLAWFHRHRVGELSRAASARTGLSLALPTHSDGSIAAEALADRLSLAGKRAPLGPFDLGLALLRVPPAQLSEDLLPRKLREPWVRTTMSLLRGWTPEWERVAGTSKGFWGHGPEEPVVTFRQRLAPRVDASPVSRLADRRDALSGAGWDRDVGTEERMVALWATYLPHRADLLAAHLHPAVFGDLSRDRGRGAPLMDALARSRNGAVQSSALVLGLTAKDARVRTSAQDALLDLARYGALDGAELGRQATAHLADGTVVGQRLAAGLNAVATVDDAAVLPVLCALELLLPVTEGRRDASAFVELAAALTQRSGRRIGVPAHLVALAAGRSTSLAAKAARRISPVRGGGGESSACPP